MLASAGICRNFYLILNGVKSMNRNDGFRYLHMGLPEKVMRKKMAGDFPGAIEEMDRLLAGQELPEAMCLCLETNKEMIKRLPSDYPYSREEAIALAQKAVPDFGEEEFDQLERENKVGWIYVNGKKHYFDRYFESLCKTDPAMARRAGLDGEPRNERYFQSAIEEMEKTGVSRRRFSCQAKVQLKDENFQKGRVVRAYLPIPCACDSQSEIRLEKITPEPTLISPENAEQRVVFWEEKMEENHPFTVEFSYVRTARYTDLWDKEKLLSEEMEQAKKCQKESAAGKKDNQTAQPDDFLKESPPHIQFTPYIQELAKTIAKEAHDDLEKARACYDFVTKHVHYSFMPAYFSLENIADNCAKNLYGDCGVQTLLFLTLCRCFGIPARWESGWAAEPGFCGAHDWARVYVKPYGWLYADVSYDGDAAARGDERRRRHYFGNLDPFRMTANTEFQADFTAPKEGFRADPYDNQVGEMEIDGRGLEYGEFVRSKSVLLCEK